MKKSNKRIGLRLLLAFPEVFIVIDMDEKNNDELIENPTDAELLHHLKTEI
jgi:hypothetical protein